MCTTLLNSIQTQHPTHALHADAVERQLLGRRIDGGSSGGSAQQNHLMQQQTAAATNDLHRVCWWCFCLFVIKRGSSVIYVLLIFIYSTLPVVEREVVVVHLVLMNNIVY
jgi:hypothetical protein